LLWLGGTALVLGVLMAFLATLSAAAIASFSSLLGNLTLFAFIIVFLIAGALKKVSVYESFLEGAKQGFEVARVYCLT